ncbi:MAG: hypothetical protein Q8R82_10045 [Hyphomonadaceae bacterium]|nr:hypothetical protein [Hyphomonadaceae bacterium]
MRVVVAVSAFIALAACATPPGTTADQAPPAPAPMITGGYGSADLGAEDTKAAQAIAVNEIYTRHPTRALVDKVSAEVQVVAGLNYRFTIVMTGGAAYRVVVFRSLQGQMSVSNFEKLA